MVAGEVEQAADDFVFCKTERLGTPCSFAIGNELLLSQRVGSFECCLQDLHDGWAQFGLGSTGLRGGRGQL